MSETSPELQQILFWPRWNEPDGMVRLWRVAKSLIRQGAFQLVIRHDPDHDGGIDTALEILNASFHHYFGDSIVVHVSVLTGSKETVGWDRIRKDVASVYLFGDEPTADLLDLGIPVAYTVENLLGHLGFQLVRESPAEVFQGNIKVLEGRDKALATRLKNAAPGAHLRRHAGQWEVRFRRHWVPLTDEPVSCVPDEDPILVLGVGIGAAVTGILEQGGVVVAWDRDPWLMAVALSQHDWSAAIKEGRLRLVLGPDIITIPQTYTQELRHPLLAQLYERELKTWAAPSQPIALVVMGELFVDDAADALERQGYGVYMWDTRHLPADELAYVAKRLQPQLVMSINYQRGLAEACHGLGLPLTVWEIDPALDSLPKCDTATNHCQIFTWRRKQVEAWGQAGFENIHHLPLAANHVRRTPGALLPTELRYQASISFVGSSLSDTLQYCRDEFIRMWQRWSNSTESAEPNQIIEYILQFHKKHPSIYVVDEMLARRCPGIRGSGENAADPNMLIGELVAHQYRRQVMESLTPFGIHVWGDEGWRGVDTRGGRFMGAASHNHDVTRVYRGSQINIDVGRRYQRDIVTMRVFDVLACGGFVLAEDCDDLRACFEPGVHLDTWTTIEELVEKTQWYLEHPDVVARIRTAGHQHLLSDHTIDQRVKTLLHSLSRPLVT